MKVMVIGSGGREHALAYRLAQSEKVTDVYVAFGNAGIDLESDEKIKRLRIYEYDHESLCNNAINMQVDLTVVGPEVPLSEGIVDYFEAKGLNIFGPSKLASQLESSKSFCKDFLKKYNIPTAEYETFEDESAAVEYVKNQGVPIVIKADGLAAGKGVVVAETEEDALDAISDMLSGNKFGEAGHKVVIEEFLQGEEASYIVLCDGENVLPLATSQDHKRVYNGDKGPNTGGMGAYSPAPVVTADIDSKIMNDVILPTMKGMASEGMPYKGFLYAGLMIDSDGNPKVIEYNCRCGDPETQPIMLRMQSDLTELCLAACNGQLDQHTIAFDPRPAVGVVLASGGYPHNYGDGKEITGLDEVDETYTKVFHAGTLLQDDKLVTKGGRVLCVTSLGDTVAEAQKRAYEEVAKISWHRMYCRTDIGYRAIIRERARESAREKE
ncbi:MAG: phosphoribosylamine--glycine ligase [Pseudomonadota bacterium]